MNVIHSWPRGGGGGGGGDVVVPADPVSLWQHMCLPAGVPC